MRIGIIEAGKVADDVKARHGDYTAITGGMLLTEDPSLSVTGWRVWEDELPATDAADAWLISGSRHGVYDDLPWIEPLKAFVRTAYVADRPMVGLCFGHQLMAEALGGRAAKSDVGWGLGVQHYEMKVRPDWLAPQIGDSFAAHAMHQDQVIAPPPGATLLASSAYCPYAALAYGPLERPTALSIQPHPEFSAELVRDLIDTRISKVAPPDCVAAARDGLGAAVDNRPWARSILSVMKRGAAS